MVAEVRVVGTDELEPLARAGEDRGDPHAVTGNAAVAAVGDDADGEHPRPVAAAVAVVLVVHRDHVA
jgi:hypothetical protein